VSRKARDELLAHHAGGAEDTDFELSHAVVSIDSLASAFARSASADSP
jgi:hypothetical protein